jgi:HlyD family secretion protein
MKEQSSLFRRESLERLSSPERLDQLMQVVAPRDWLGLVAIGFLLCVGVGWSILGKIPLTVTGRGVLVQPYRVVELQSPVTGRLQQLNVKVGDRVRKGQVLGLLDQADLQEQLRQQQAKLVELQRQDQELDSLSNQRLAAELQTLLQQRRTLQQRLQDAQELNPVQRQRDLQALLQQRRTLQQQIQDAEALIPILQARLQSRRQLQREGAIATDAVLQAEQSYRDNASQISALQTQLRELESREVTTERTYRDSLTQVSSLRAELQNLDSRAKNLRQQQVEARTSRRNQMQQVQQEIARLRQNLQDSGQILSQQDGRVLEVSAIPGQVVNSGSRLAAIEAGRTPGTLVSLVYLPVRNGKQLRPGMPVQVIPDNIQQEEFGGMTGSIREVSAFPVTRQAIATAIGSLELAEGMVFPGGQMQAIVALEADPDTPTGYRWTSSTGPNLQLSPGTTTSVRVVVGEQSPIAFVLPLLRSTTGVR